MRDRLDKAFRAGAHAGLVHGPGRSDALNPYMTGTQERRVWYRGFEFGAGLYTKATKEIESEANRQVWSVQSMLLVPSEDDPLGLTAIDGDGLPFYCRAVTCESWMPWCGDPETCERAILLAVKRTPHPAGIARAARLCDVGVQALTESIQFLLDHGYSNGPMMLKGGRVALLWSDGMEIQP